MEEFWKTGVPVACNFKKNSSITEIFSRDFDQIY